MRSYVSFWRHKLSRPTRSLELVKREKEILSHVAQVTQMEATRSNLLPDSQTVNFPQTLDYLRSNLVRQVMRASTLHCNCNIQWVDGKDLKIQKPVFHDRLREGLTRECICICVLI